MVVTKGNDRQISQLDSSLSSSNLQAGINTSFRITKCNPFDQTVSREGAGAGLLKCQLHSNLQLDHHASSCEYKHFQASASSFTDLSFLHFSSTACVACVWIYNKLIIPMAWRIMSCIKRQTLDCKKKNNNNKLPDRTSFKYTTLPYSVIILTCSDEATSVGYRFNIHDLGGPTHHDGQVAVQLTVHVQCCLLAMNAIFSPSFSGLPPY